MSKFPHIDFSKVKQIHFSSRKSKVKIEDFCSVPPPNPTFDEFFHSLPKILKGNEFIEIVNKITDAYQDNRTVLLMIGAHIIKCGLNPILIEWIKRGVISALAGNGACAIHDFEIAMWGKTSEDVAENIEDGTFGMVRETGDTINGAISEGAENGLGFGESIGKKLVDINAPNCAESLLATSYKENMQMTIHVAIGTDIVHQHPTADGAAIGKTTYRDFEKITSVVSTLGDGGVVLNFGSAVIMPEVFLKALTVARNLGYGVKNFTSANFDMNRHYRPTVNIVKRPVLSGGKGYEITGHHELMIPLLSAGIFAEMYRRNLI